MNRSPLVCLIVGVSLAIVAPAGALSRSGVEVSFDCPSVSESAFAAALEVELGTRKARAALAVDVRCEEYTATLRTPGLDPIVTRLDRERNDVRPRLLALAVAELVRDHDAQPRVEPPQARDLPAPVPAPDPGVVLSATPTVLGFRMQRAVLGGGELGLAHVGAWLVPGFSLGVLQGERDTSLAALRTRLLYVRPTLALARVHGPIAFRFGASLRFGQARLSAHALAPDARHRTVRGLWVAPDLTASFLARLHARLWLVVHGTLGATLRPVTGEVEAARDAAASGPFASLGLGVEVRL